jgi:hypothetical protein
MKHIMLRSLVVAVTMLAAVSTDAGAQIGGVRPIQLHRSALRNEADALGRVTLHLQQMDAAHSNRPISRQTPDHATHLETMVPRHTRLLAALLDHFSSEAFDRTNNSEREALELEVQQDLARLPELRGAEFEDFFPGHSARVKRLIEIHRAAHRLN